jgi:tetratricopeptide (TPR) repeat protein
VVSQFDRAGAEAAHVVQLARQRGDRIQEARALARLAWAAIWHGDPEGAVAHSREAIQVAGPLGNEEVLARAYFTIAYARAGTGDLAEARESIARALPSGRSSETRTYLSLSLTVAGHLKTWEGEYGAASQLQAEGLQLAREHNLLVPLLFSFFFHGLTLSGQGDYDRALALFREGLTLAERVGEETIHLSRLLNCLGWLHLELGDFDRAIDLSRRSAEMAGRGRRERTFRNAEINLGNIFLAKGDLLQAGELLDGASRVWDLSATTRWLRWRYSMRLFDSLGRLWLARGDLARAQEFADQCLRLATTTSSRKNVVKASRLGGEIALLRRNFDDAEVAFRHALSVASAIGNPTQLWKTQLAWGQFCTARQRPDEAGEAYRAARAVLEQVKAGVQDPALRACLEQVPGVRHAYELAGPR